MHLRRAIAGQFLDSSIKPLTVDRVNELFANDADLLDGALGNSRVPIHDERPDFSYAVLHPAN
jgi:hypothetical protein